jgi:hypothetical protein
MRLIECLPYALCRFHTRSFILRSDVRFMMRIECASNMVNAFTRTSKRLRFPLFTWKYLHFLYVQKIVLLQCNLCQLKTPCHRCEAFRACDAHLMGIKCTCEGGIHRFTMYLQRIRKRNTVEQHKAVSLRSQIVGV